MINLSNQPFLLSLKQAANHLCCASRDFETILQAQHDMFKEFVYEQYNSGIPAPNRFFFE